MTPLGVTGIPVNLAALRKSFCLPNREACGACETLGVTGILLKSFPVVDLSLL